MIPVGHSRPNIPEYPQIAENIKQAIDEVYLGVKEPKQALDDGKKFCKNTRMVKDQMD